MLQTEKEILTYLEKKRFQKRIDKITQKVQNKKVIIYSIGKVFDLVIDHYDLSKLNIIGLADMKFQENETYKGYKTFSAEIFLEQKPDVVLIGAINAYKILDYFENELEPKFGNFKAIGFFKPSFWSLLKKLFVS